VRPHGGGSATRGQATDLGGVRGHLLQRRRHRVRPPAATPPDARAARRAGPAHHRALTARRPILPRNRSPRHRDRAHDQNDAMISARLVSYSCWLSRPASQSSCGFCSLVTCPGSIWVAPGGAAPARALNRAACFCALQISWLPCSARAWRAPSGKTTAASAVVLAAR